MRIVFILLTLVLVGCKPDPIEACVEAEKNSAILDCENIYAKEGEARKCPPDDIKVLITISEPRWRKECMRAAAGKED
jgi:hypothetical protein